MKDGGNGGRQIDFWHDVGVILRVPCTAETSETPAKLFTALVYSLLFVGVLGCGHKASSTEKGKVPDKLKSVEAPRPDNCPVEKAAPALLPGTSEAYRQADYWYKLIEERGTVDLDEVLMSAGDIRDLNASMRVPRKAFFPQQDLLEALDQPAFLEKLDERFVWMQGKLESGEYVMEGDREVFSKPSAPAFAPQLRVALQETQMFCAPTTVGIYDKDATSKRINRNTCSGAHPQELIEIVAPWSGGMQLARTATSWGFVTSDAALSPQLDVADATAFARGPYANFGQPTTIAEQELAAHTRLPLINPAAHEVALASVSGVSHQRVDKDAYVASTQPLTRRAIIAEALSYVGMPYGFGGLDGGIDCSRLEVAGLPDDKKLALIDQANASGVVLLELPGHIMLYLGHDEKDVPMAVHALAYYLESCESGQSIRRDVGQVQVGGLELGRGTEKTALIERIARVTVLGKEPVAAIRSLARLRPAAPVRRPSSKECRKLPSRKLFVSPAHPEPGQTVHVVATTRSDVGPATISFFDSRGNRQDSLSVQTNGPPTGFIGELPSAKLGSWMAVWGDGEQAMACTTFRVSRANARKPSTLEKAAAVEFAALKATAAMADLSPALSEPEDEDESSDLREVPLVGAPIWNSKREWSSSDEDLFATFAERLFDYPIEDDVEWSNFYSLLRDPSHNILFNHFGRDEEERLTFVPDCADLPYTMRAYFAWKLGLPFGLHECKRARDNRAPECVQAEGNLMARINFTPGDDVDMFKSFVNKHLRRTVHSSSGRTGPDDDLSDFYPIPLNRASLRPGTLFTDPYGHLLVVVKWIEQGTTGYGALIGADAQPDGTVGRRRFWQGSFIFEPETKAGGAGFKAFRPWKIDKLTKALVTVPNDELKRNRTARFSREQYKGSKSDFYDRMEAIINPRALDPKDKMLSLVSALDEQSTRRVTSVKVGEDFMREHAFAPIVMPEGAKIFLTSGPWEDFATPSRDWRLLVAIDTVLDFPDAVRRSPGQYGIEESEVEAQVALVRQALDKELESRTLDYVRSDGSKATLTLKDLVDRRVDFEMSYNPNDCPEIRWAAPEGSPERTTCKRNAPVEQREKMQGLRAWFSERRRPAL